MNWIKIFDWFPFWLCQYILVVKWFILKKIYHVIIWVKNKLFKLKLTNKYDLQTQLPISYIPIEYVTLNYLRYHFVSQFSESTGNALFPITGTVDYLGLTNFYVRAKIGNYSEIFMYAILYCKDKQEVLKILEYMKHDLNIQQLIHKTTYFRHFLPSPNMKFISIKTPIIIDDFNFDLYMSLVKENFCSMDISIGYPSTSHDGKSLIKQLIRSGFHIKFDKHDYDYSKKNYNSHIFWYAKYQRLYYGNIRHLLSKDLPIELCDEVMKFM